MGQVCATAHALQDKEYCVCSGGDPELDESLLAHVVQVNTERPSFPPSQSSIVSALCVSGGGARALSFTLGVFRALHHLGLLPKFEAVSSVSGGSWASSILMFATEHNGAKIDTDELLGAATSPSKLSMDALHKKPAPLGATVTADADSILQKAALSVTPGQVWIQGIGEWILGPFGLSSLDAFMTSNAEDRDRILADNPALLDKTFHLPRPDRPGTFVINGIWLAPVGFYAGVDGVVGLQMSPDWTGSPFYPNDEKVSYIPPAHLCRDAACIICCPAAVSVPCVLLDGCDTKFCSVSRIVGGGFVETFAAGGLAPAPAGQSGGKVRVGYPKQPLSLAKAIGISSFAPAQSLEMLAGAGRAANPKMYAWPVTSPILPGPQRARHYEMGDGGELENSGCIAMLQRGAKRITWIASSYMSISSTYDFANATPETFDPTEAGVIDQVADKFGYGRDGNGFVYSHNQVFEKGLLLELVRDLIALRGAGRPAVVRRSYKVLPNGWWGLRGGAAVDILLIYLEKVSGFEAKLPQATQKELAKGAQGPFENYPIYKTTGNNKTNQLGLTACQVNLLAAQAEFSVTQNAGMFKQFLS